MLHAKANAKQIFLRQIGKNSMFRLLHSLSHEVFSLVHTSCESECSCVTIGKTVRIDCCVTITGFREINSLVANTSWHQKLCPSYRKNIATSCELFLRHVVAKVSRLVTKNSQLVASNLRQVAKLVLLNAESSWLVVSKFTTSPEIPTTIRVPSGPPYHTLAYFTNRAKETLQWRHNHN